MSQHTLPFPGSLARRVITGISEQGQGSIIYDDAGGNVKKLPNGVILQRPWWTETVPADCSINTNQDPTGNLNFRGTNEGSISAFLWMPPGGKTPMHANRSIDYAIVLEGELELELDSGDKRLLKPGDLVVQRETQHTWHNRSTTRWVKVFTVMIASKSAVGKQPIRPSQSTKASQSPPSIRQTPGIPPGTLTRRVVTGVDKEGKSEVIYDDTAGHITNLPNGARLQDPWWTDTVPADCSQRTNLDPTGSKNFRITNEGSVASILWMPPGGSSPMHATKSIDYCLVMEGEIELELDGGDRTVLRPGDVIVQRETPHAWHNRSKTQWAKIFSVLIATKNAVSTSGSPSPQAATQITEAPISRPPTYSTVDKHNPGPLARRVVTGIREEGKAHILYEDDGGHVTNLPNGTRLQDSWWTDTVPADCSTATNIDPTGNKTFRVSNEGAVATFVWMPPGASSPMHTTKSIDYGIVVEGEIELELDSGERTVLKSGDLIVQRETQHAWHNRSDTQWVKIFSVLIATNNAARKEEGR